MSACRLLFLNALGAAKALHVVQKDLHQHGKCSPSWAGLVAGLPPSQIKKGLQRSMHSVKASLCRLVQPTMWPVDAAGTLVNILSSQLEHASC